MDLQMEMTQQVKTVFFQFPICFFFVLIFSKISVTPIADLEICLGGDSSKSNSVTSEHSLHSVGVSASSKSSSSNSLPAGAAHDGASGTKNYRYESDKFCFKVYL